MIIAHTSPWGGVLNVTEYLTAPWFALLVGMSLLLAWDRADGRAGLFILGNTARGVILIAVGEWLQRTYGQIDVVLQTLGLLTIVLAPAVVLVGQRWQVWTSVAAVMAVLSPIVMSSGRAWLDGGGWETGWVGHVVELAAAGTHYRVTSFLAIAAAGIAAVPALRAGWGTGRRGVGLTIGLTTAAAAVYVFGKASPWGADAYSGSTPEIVGAILLSLAATVACAWITGALGERRVRAWIGAVVDTGRMAFTACLATSWAWLRVFPTGPLEMILRLPATGLVRAIDRPRL